MVRNERHGATPIRQKTVEEIDYNKKLKDLSVKEKELGKQEKNLKKKEFDTEQLTRQLSSARALIISLEEKVNDCNKENDNLKLHLLSTNSTSQTGTAFSSTQASHIANIMQIDMNVMLRLQTIENEILRLRLDSRNIVAPSDSGNRMRQLEERIRLLELENRNLVDKLTTAEFKTQQVVMPQAYVHPSYVYQNVPVHYGKGTGLADRHVKVGNNNKGNGQVNSINHRTVSRGTNPGKTYSNMDRARKKQPKRTENVKVSTSSGFEEIYVSKNDSQITQQQETNELSATRN